jgi:PhnB protein
MTSRNEHVRHGVGCVRPYLHGPIGLPEFVQQVFGAVELERHVFSEQSRHVELQLGDAVIVIEAGILPPDNLPWKNAVYVYVEDVDRVYAKALEHGATPLVAPEDKPYQERQAGFTDSAGNTWWIATYQRQLQ